MIGLPCALSLCIAILLDIKERLIHATWAYT